MELDIDTLHPFPNQPFRPYKEEEMDKLKDFKASQIYKLMGNSIVVDVLEAVFYEYFKALKEEGRI